MPPDIELDMLLSTLDQKDFDYEAMIADWAAGDLERIEHEDFALLEDGFPELYKALMVDRNRSWADQIPAHLDGAGTVVVVVGVGHFVGDDDLVAMLEAAGRKVERVR